jgi:hypothetical protein
LIEGSSHHSVIKTDRKMNNPEMEPATDHYRLMVDEILRRKIGIDFDTALSLQRYIATFLESSKGGARCKSTNANRVELRWRIVRRAQEIWEQSTTVPRMAEPIQFNWQTASWALDSAKTKSEFDRAVVHARDRWAPTAKLPIFLFSSYDLGRFNVDTPSNEITDWLPDPTLGLAGSRELRRIGVKWVGRTARDMLSDLICSEGAQATVWGIAAERWHIQRLQADIDSWRYLELSAQLASPGFQPTPLGSGCCRPLIGLAEQLGLDRETVCAALASVQSTDGDPASIEPETKLAIATFNKIISRGWMTYLHGTCVGCDGIRAIVKRQRARNPSIFWNRDDWIMET